MYYRLILLLLILFTAALAGCDQYNAGVRSFYGLKTDNYKVAEARIIQLYRDGTFETNSDSLTILIARSTPGFAIDSAKNEWAADGYRKYQLDTVVKQDFVVFDGRSQTYYYYEIINCGGAFGCDVHVRSIVKKDPATGKRVDVQWQDAEPSLQEFEENLLPIIREIVKYGRLQSRHPTNLTVDNHSIPQHLGQISGWKSQVGIRPCERVETQHFASRR